MKKCEYLCVLDSLVLFINLTNLRILQPSRKTTRLRVFIYDKSHGQNFKILWKFDIRVEFFTKTEGTKERLTTNKRWKHSQQFTLCMLLKSHNSYKIIRLKCTCDIIIHCLDRYLKASEVFLLFLIGQVIAFQEIHYHKLITYAVDLPFSSFPLIIIPFDVI